MPPQLTYLWLGTVALALSAAAWRLAMVPQSREQVVAAQISGVAAMFAWALWSIYGFDITVITSTSSISASHLGLVFLGMAAAFIMLIFSYMAVLRGFGTVADEPGMEVGR